MKICNRDDTGQLVMNKTHKYYYQIQAQMLVTNIKVCFLVAFTHKGIKVVNVDFDDAFCEYTVNDMEV